MKDKKEKNAKKDVKREKLNKKQLSKIAGGLVKTAPRSGGGGLIS